jgi:4-diphosphocytidyl-2-C-methyl-D-erythritol kinase
VIADAPAKLNLALVVGDERDDGLHEVATVLQRLDLHDTIELDHASTLRVDGFAGDTIVRAALETLAAAVGIEPRWQARIEKRIPVAAGLGGGSSDAATTLQLANATLAEPLAPEAIRELARTLGADVPFFLEPGPQLGTGDGSTLEPLELPQEYAVVILLPRGVAKESTGAVYGSYRPAPGFEARREVVIGRARGSSLPRDLAELPLNDLATSPLAARLSDLGAFRADVSGAGPAVYGLFEDRGAADEAAAAVARLGDAVVTHPAW